MKWNWKDGLRTGLVMAIIGELLTALGLFSLLGVSAATTALIYSGPGLIGGFIALFIIGIVADFANGLI